MMAIVLAGSTAGCAMASVRMHAGSDPTGPISLTATVYDPAGEPLRVGDGLEVVAHFDHSERIWSLLFGAVPVSGDIDVTSIANAEMAKANGVAVVNLTIETTSNGMVKYIGSLVPILPMYVFTRIEGDVVRVVPRAGGES